MSDGVNVVPTSGSSVSYAFLTIFGLGDVKVRWGTGFVIRSLIYKSFNTGVGVITSQQMAKTTDSHPKSYVGPFHYGCSIQNFALYGAN